MSDTELQRLIAIEEIKYLKAQYFRCIDQKDWEAWRALFCDDGRFETVFGLINGADEFVASVQQGIGSASTIHHGHMPEIDVLGPDEATAVWTFFDALEPTAESGDAPFYGFGRYWERYERREGKWKIASLTVERVRQVDAPL